MKPPVRAIVLSGFGINCDYETRYALTVAGARTDRVHINHLIDMGKTGPGLGEYHILAIDGGFSWADDHGAGVLLALKLRAGLGSQLEDFIAAGKLVIGICNGFQALVNMGLLPGLDGDYHRRQVALTANDCGNYRDDWVHLLVNEQSPCVFTQGISTIDLPIRHGEGNFYTPPEVLDRLVANHQIVLRYAKPVPRPRPRGTPYLPPPPPDLVPADGEFPYNPNGALGDIAGICDPHGRVFGLMPHPEGFHHLTNHPDWTRRVDHPRRWGRDILEWEGEGLKIFRNAVMYIENNVL